MTEINEARDRDLARLYAALLALEAAEDELAAMHDQMDGVASELLEATAAVVAMRTRLRRLRNPFFKQRMERFQTRRDMPDGTSRRE